MFTAQKPEKGTFVIRYPRGRGRIADWRCPLEEIPIGKGRKMREGSDIAVVTLGPIGNLAADAIQALSKQPGAPSVAHYDLRFLKPLDEEMLHEIGENFSRIVTVEDCVRMGGMGSAVLEWMADHGYKPEVRRLGLPDTFVEHGTIPELQSIVGIDAESIRKAIENF